MAKITDRIEERPYMCEDCKHFLSGAKCRAFDLIPIEIYEDPEAHTAVVPGKKGTMYLQPISPATQCAFMAMAM